MNDQSKQPVPRRAGKITDAEFALVIDTLRTDGPDAAMEILSRGQTQGDGRPSRRTTLADDLERNPMRRAAWDDALQTYLSKFRRTFDQNALTPDHVREFDASGNLLREKLDRRNMNWCLLQILRRWDPAWRDTKRVEVDGKVDHRHAHAHAHLNGGGFQIHPNELMMLPPDRAQLLLDLLDELQTLKETTNERIGTRVLPSPQRSGEASADEAADGQNAD